MTIELDQWHYFTSPVYTVQKPEFLEDALTVCNTELKNAHDQRETNEIYPVTMTGQLLENPKLEQLITFIGDTGWHILATQGYAMDNFVLNFTEFWCQEHNKYSSMEYHTHPNCHLVGFYFLECPEDCPRVIVHDPRPGRVMCALPEADMSNATTASVAINFTPKPGMLMFANSWLPHSFNRNPSDKPFKFIHFNLVAVPGQTVFQFPEAEVI